MTEMTEADWLRRMNLPRLLSWARGGDRDPSPAQALATKTLSHRKLRLFTVACCRQVWHAIDHAPARQAVVAAELFTDGQITRDDLACRWTAADTELAKGESPERLLRQCARDCADLKLARRGEVGSPSGVAELIAGLHPKQLFVQPAMLVDIVGNPFAPVALDATFRSAPHVPALARACYEDRADNGALPNDALGILADALEDAGCDLAPLLKHLRSTGLHVRGCWALDMVLGKE